MFVTAQADVGQRQPRKPGSDLVSTAAILDVPDAAACEPEALRAQRLRKGVGHARGVCSESSDGSGRRQSVVNDTGAFGSTLPPKPIDWPSNRYGNQN